MDRKTAFEALGLPPNASRKSVRRAFEHMRAHLMERALGSSGRAGAAARLAELAALESALGRELAGDRNAARRRVVGLGSAAALALAGVLGWALSSTAPSISGPAVPAEDPPPVASEGPDPAAPAEPASLAVSAPVDGARYALLAPGGEALLEAAADGAFHELDPAPGGPLALEVRHPDCIEGASRDLDLPPGARVELEVQPCPTTGWLVVRSNVSGDSASADGRRLGPTGPERHPLPVGDVGVRVEKPGYQTWSDQTRIEPGQVVELRARMRRTPAPPAQARVESEAARTAAGITGDMGGTRGWFESVSSWMVAHHDADGTGLIDAPIEVAAISCNTWQALEISYETGQLGAPMSRLYGFDGSRWVPGALGFDVRVRDQAYERMRACGLR
ncbi:MAG: PEGA domain-containing protein [Myxococcota bacterium]